MNNDLLIAGYLFIALNSNKFVSDFFTHLFIHSFDLYQIFLRQNITQEQLNVLFMEKLKIIIYGLKYNKDSTIIEVAKICVYLNSLGVEPMHFETIKFVFFSTVKRNIGSGYTPETRKTWLEFFATLDEIREMVIF